MANVTLGPLVAVNMDLLDYAGLFFYEDTVVVPGAVPPEVILSDDPANYTSFVGPFTFDAGLGQPTAGTISEITNVAAGRTVIRITGLSYDAVTFYTQARFDPALLRTQLFAGNDAMTGSGFSDLIDAQGGNDTVNAGAGADTVRGGAGNDQLSGGLGADSLIGGTGNDRYFVDNAADRVVEAAGGAGGVDVVEATVSWTLQAGAAVEVLRAYPLTGTAPITLVGNELAHTILGNDGANSLVGGAGNDSLDGRRGADTMVGGTGNDTFSVDNAGDRVIEFAGGGTGDVVLATISWALASGTDVEILRAALPASTAALDLTGNALANRLVGNAGANRLDGGGGRDVYLGYAGNDTFVGGAGQHDVADYRGDGAPAGIRANLSATAVQNGVAAGTIRDGFGASDSVPGITDVLGSAFADTMAGGADANRLSGFGGTDALSGGVGADTLAGGSGADLLSGGGDADWFVFDTAPVSAERDVIVDFTPGVDKLVFENAVFAQIGPGSTAGTPIAATAFQLLLPPVYLMGSEARIGYRPDTGVVYYDIDGLGPAMIQQAVVTLLNKPALTAADILII